MQRLKSTEVKQFFQKAGGGGIGQQALNIDPYIVYVHVYTLYNTVNRHQKQAMWPVATQNVEKDADIMQGFDCHCNRMPWYAKQGSVS